MSIKPNGTSVTVPRSSRFKLASPTDPNSFTPPPSPFIEELRSQLENPTFNYKDKQNISWLQIHSIPEKVIRTLKKLSMKAHASKSPGLHMSIRCAISTGLAKVEASPYRRELRRLEVLYEHLPQIAEPRELFVGQYLSAPLVIDFEGRRYNVPVADSMKHAIGGIAKSPCMREHDIATWAIHLALLHRESEIPDAYRSEWAKKVSEIEGLIQMKVKGAVAMIRELPGGEDVVSIVPSGLRGLDSEHLQELLDVSPDSPSGQEYEERIDMEGEDVH